MPSFVLTFRQPAGRGFNPDEAPAWFKWIDEISDHITVPGSAVMNARQLGNVEGGQTISGFSVIEARDMDHAAELAAGCPAITLGYGLEIGELMDARAEAAA
jgi:hypothetical protein